MRNVMTRVFPLPAPARISTGPSTVSTASRCCGFSSSRNDKRELLPQKSVSKYYIALVERRESPHVRPKFVHNCSLENPIRAVPASSPRTTAGGGSKVRSRAGLTGRPSLHRDGLYNHRLRS